MATTNLKTIEALEAFLEGNQLAAFAVPGNIGILITLLSFNASSHSTFRKVI